MPPGRRVWFPQPRTADDLVPLGPVPAPGRRQLFELLTDPAAEELRDRVGVTSPADGSAKVTTRLLASAGWFFKTDQDRREAAEGGPRAYAESLAEAAVAAGRLWHPAKVYLLLHDGDWWWPLTACPAMTTLRRIDDWAERVRLWAGALRLSLRHSRERSVGLDMNPANFAVDPADGELYYLDDEVYAPLQLADLASFVAARIPEELYRTPDDWSAWGSAAGAVFAADTSDPDHWNELIERVRDYPLTARFRAAREAAVSGLVTHYPYLKRRPKSSPPGGVPVKPAAPPAPKLTAVFADVHGNLPALEAVLAECRELEVDSYLFLGDVVGYGPHPRECLELIRSLKNATLIRGNHDHMTAQGEAGEEFNRHARAALEWTQRRMRPADAEWLASLPVEASGPGWLAVHGSPICPVRYSAYVYELTYLDNLAALEERGTRLCFYGHSHVQFVYRRTAAGSVEKFVPTLLAPASGEHVLVNPGSVGQPRDGDSRAAFAVWERRENRLHFRRAEYPVEKTMAAIREAGLPEDLAVRLELGR